MFESLVSYFAEGDAPDHAVILATFVCFASLIVLGSRALWLLSRQVHSYVVKKSAGKADEASPKTKYHLAAIGALASFTATLLVGFRTIEESTRQQAESRVQEQGYVIGGYEFENPELRCVYSWHDAADAGACRASLFRLSDQGTRDSWSLSMLYVEEVLGLFAASKNSRSRYGADDYDDDVQYWREDVMVDPVGLFSFQVVSEGEEMAKRSRQRGDNCDAVCAVQMTLCETGLEAMGPNICAGYDRMYSNAPLGFFRERASMCRSSESPQALSRPCPTIMRR